VYPCFKFVWQTLLVRYSVGPTLFRATYTVGSTKPLKHPKYKTQKYQFKAHIHIKTNNIKKHGQMLYNPVVFITISNYSIHVSDNRVLNVATLGHNVHFLKQVTSDYTPSCSST
jgi:hypothetical protein